jgi:ribosome modulation factor
MSKTDDNSGDSFAAPTGSAFLRTIVEGLAVVACFETLEDCYQQGEAASSQAYAREQNPYPKGDARREWWDGGWCDELDELCGER